MKTNNFKCDRFPCGESVEMAELAISAEALSYLTSGWLPLLIALSSKLRIFFYRPDPERARLIVHECVGC